MLPAPMIGGVVDDLRGAGPDAAAVEGALPGRAGEAGFLGVRAEEVRRHLLLEAEHGDEQRRLRSGEAPGQAGAGRDADVVLRADGVGAQVRRGALRNEHCRAARDRRVPRDAGAAHPSAATHRNAAHRFVKLATRLTIDCLRRRRLRPWAGRRVLDRDDMSRHVKDREPRAKDDVARRIFLLARFEPRRPAGRGSARQVGRDRPARRAVQRGEAGAVGGPLARLRRRRRLAAGGRRRASATRPRRRGRAPTSAAREQALRLPDAPVVGRQARRAEPERLAQRRLGGGARRRARSARARGSPGRLAVVGMVGGQLGAADAHALGEHALGFVEPSLQLDAPGPACSAYCGVLVVLGAEDAAIDRQRPAAPAPRRRPDRPWRISRLARLPIDAPVLGWSGPRTLQRRGEVLAEQRLGAGEIAAPHAGAARGRSCSSPSRGARRRTTAWRMASASRDSGSASTSRP